MFKTIFLIMAFYFSINTVAQEQKFRVEAGGLITHFQQQVKPKVGDLRGQRLVNEFQLGLLISGTYTLTNYFSAGLFLRADRGERAAATFDSFDEMGRTITLNQIGGTYTEFWFGPLLQFKWKQLSFEAGYALVGLRDDKGRKDIPSETGNTENAFTTHPFISWMLNLGGNFPILDNLDIIFKIEYRNRYYNERGGERLFDDIDHGTQSISPIIGAAFKF